MSEIVNRKEITEQEAFWAGEFGDQYTARNCGDSIIAGDLALFGQILRYTGRLSSVLELGANRGLNLRALRLLLPQTALAAIEINRKAAMELRQLKDVKVYEQSIHDFETKEPYDMVFTKGVLIHLKPETLPHVYDLLFTSSRRYILFAEYYSPIPVDVTYRDHRDKLFKRDFAGEMLTRFKSLQLKAYGFSYHRDPQFPQDDLNWFLLEKSIGLPTGY